MAGDWMFSEERRRLIVEEINKRNHITVDELCKVFSASPGTIRNDLNALHNLGLVHRTHGGAICIGQSSFEYATTDKQILHLSEKIRIAEQALKLINDGDTLVIDTGTTTRELAKLLGCKNNLNVVTNDLQIAIELEKHKSVGIIFIGGVVRNKFHCTIGPQAINELSDLSVDKSFLATNGISISNSITTPNIDLAEIKKKYITIAKQVYLLCDSSKFGHASFKKYATINDMTSIITNKDLDKKYVQELENSGVNFYLT